MAQAARVLLYALLVWAPLPLGSNRPVFWVVNGIAATAVLALFVAGEATQSYKTRFDWRPAALVLLTLAVWAVWIVIQALPGTPQSLQHPLWTELAGSLSGSSGAISINPGSTWTTAAQVIPIAFLAIVAMRLAHDQRRTEFLLQLIVGVTVGVATYGLVARAIGFTQIFFITDPPDAAYLTGTFVARNAAATYFVIGLGTAAALLLTAIERRLKSAGDRKLRFIDVIDAVRHGGVYLAACLILATALLNTGSRGGVISGAIALLCATLFWALGAPISRRALGSVLAVVTLAVVTVAFASSDTLVQRLESGVDTQGRLLAYQDTIQMIMARPLLGHGAGTFIDAFPLYHDQAPSIGVWNAAHNSYLQLAADLGIPVAGLILACGALVLAYMILRLHRRTDLAPATIAAVTVAFAVGFHASVDFSVQFQAVGLTLVVLLGAGLGEGLVYGRTDGGEKRRGIDETFRNVVAVGQRETVAVSLPAAERAFVGQAVAPTSAPHFLNLHRGGHIGLSRTARAVVRKAQALAIRRAATGTDDEPADVDALALESRMETPSRAARPRGRLTLVPAVPQERETLVDPTGGIPSGEEDPDRGPVYVFGDLHGRLDLLLRLRDAIAHDQRLSPGSPTVVGLGDYVDRGPDSCGVMDALAGDLFGCKTVLLRGNHEQMVLDFLEDPEGKGAIWLRNGAIDALRSYGVDVTALIGATAPPVAKVREALVARIPVSHLVTLQRMPCSYMRGGYFFAHAGARSGVPLAQQTADDLLWIRKGFADCDTVFEKTVVHGHTPVEKPYFGEYRVNLDTGAYFSNRISCLVLEGDQRRLLDV